MTRVAGLVLAAGAGSRLGRPKAVVELAGERLVDRAVRLLADGGIADAYVVSGAVPLAVRGATVIGNPHWSTGMGSSLRAGLAGMPDHVEAAVVVLVDHVGLTAAAIARVTAAASGPTSLVAATYAGRQGHPVLIGRTWWDEVGRTAAGDQGARDLLRAHPEELVRVECGDVADDRDVDTPEDLERLGRTPPEGAA